MGSPDLISEHVSIYGESEPLSPRLYEPGPPPPTPPTGRPGGVPEQPDESRLSPRRMGFPGFGRTPRTAAPTTQNFSEQSAQPELHSKRSDNIIPLRDLTKQKRAPAPPRLHVPTAGNNPNTQNLPLRSAPLPLRNPNPSNYSDRPPSMIKATVLERTIPEHLRGPRTGVPATPYSPYMPFTPLTPMTPSRLITKQERKRMEKEAGRRVATVEDAVDEESEMWGDGFK
jgi:hypothetical protein